MEAKNEVAPGRILQFIDQFIVPHMVGNQLAFPMAKWVCARGPHGEVERTGYCLNSLPELAYILKGFLGITADIGAYLHHSLVHFGLYFILDDLLAFDYYFLIVAFELFGYRVYYHIFFFYPQGKMIVVDGHVLQYFGGGGKSFLLKKTGGLLRSRYRPPANNTIMDTKQPFGHYD
jgi:hypothetical protein